LYLSEGVLYGVYQKHILWKINSWSFAENSFASLFMFSTLMLKETGERVVENLFLWFVDHHALNSLITKHHLQINIQHTPEETSHMKALSFLCQH